MGASKSNSADAEVVALLGSLLPLAEGVRPWRAAVVAATATALLSTGVQHRTKLGAGAADRSFSRTRSAANARTTLPNPMIMSAAVARNFDPSDPDLHHATGT